MAIRWLPGPLYREGFELFGQFLGPKIFPGARVDDLGGQKKSGGGGETLKFRLEILCFPGARLFTFFKFPRFFIVVFFVVFFFPKVFDVF